ncbi:sensor histidine kinase [Paenibacillus sp. Marseille-P2973]|uniref:sensor histidine kinase n=1 Tax=Paenibacillus sp. Marseille-P2973 TaxID=1871032 RepID=UPI001B36AAAD|nr:sensor histidine kinase [Paenibacillus sp. Marseille-P2973]
MERVSESFMDNLSYLGQSLEFDMKEWERIIDSLQVNHTMESIFTSKYDSDVDYFFDVKKAGQVFDDWAYASNMYKYISSLVLIGSNGKIIRYGDDVGHLDVDKLIRKDWLQELKTSDGKLVWLGIHENYADVHYRTPYVISLAKRLDYGKHDVIVYMSFKSQFFVDKLNTKHDPNNNLYLLDGHNKIVYNREAKIINERYENPINTRVKGDTVRRSSNGEKILVASLPLSNTGWSIVETIPLSTLTEGYSLIFKVTVIVFLLSVCFSGIIWFVIASKIVNPIQRLARVMNRVQGNEPSVITMSNRKDEIGQLTQNFNYMMKRIDRLHQEHLQDQAKKNEAEYRALQAQINPHFLYNTLNSIRWMATIQHADNIRETVEVLGRLLRNTIKTKETMIPIHMELELLNDYIYIQKVRYNDKFEVLFELEPSIKGYRCLKFILQPIVENAIFHGIEPKDERGTITVRVFQEQERIVFEVHDNGVGMPEEVSEKLLSCQEGKDGIGLRNVHERLQRTFGKDYGLEIESRCGEYTLIRINHPVILQQEDQ